MSMLLSRADQAVSVTDIARSAKKYFDRLISGEQDRYVVMRNNTPAAVMLSVEEYEQLMDELSDLQIDRIAAARLAAFSPDDELVSHEDMLAHFK